MKYHYVVTVDGGALGNGTDDVQCYGSALIVTADGKSKVIGWDDIGNAGTNNEAEYESLILALNYLESLIEDAGRSPKDYDVLVRMDSALVLNQVFGTWKVKAAGLWPLMRRAKNAALSFKSVGHEQISGDQMKQILGH